MSLKPARGYLLLDIMMGGALAAVVLGTLVGVLASARSKNVAATRDIVATQLVLEKIDESRNKGFNGVVASAATPVSGQTGLYTRTIAVASGSDTATYSMAGGPGVMTYPFKDVTVTVTYKSENVTRTSQATTRIYQ